MGFQAQKVTGTLEKQSHAYFWFTLKSNCVSRGSNDQPLTNTI